MAFTFHKNDTDGKVLIQGTHMGLDIVSPSFVIGNLWVRYGPHIGPLSRIVDIG